MNNNSIWIEKYRPTDLNDIIGQDNNIELLKTLMGVFLFIDSFR